jgi:peptidoglycan/xylan/chitin deacetylase (PgdA/CDA1 family)
MGIPATVFVAAGFLGDGMMFNDRVIESVRAAKGPELDLTELDLGCYPVRNADERRAAIHQLLPALKYLPERERDQKARAIADRVGYRPNRPLMLDTDGVRTLVDRGVTIGAHTLTHPILTETADAIAAEEIAASKRALEDITGGPVTLFAYPNGRPGRDYADRHVAMVKDAGFQAAVSTRYAPAARDADPYQLPRFTPWDTTPGRFLARLLANGFGLVRQ